MASKKYRYHQIPPCPDPDRYVLVKTDEGYFWRRKRGTKKEATLNTELSRRAGLAKHTAPAAKRILDMLSAFMTGMKKGRLVLRINALLVKSLQLQPVPDFKNFKGLELNDGYPLELSYKGQWRISVDEESRTVTLLLKYIFVEPQNTLVSDYYFEAIVIWGDIMVESGLQVRSESSPLFSFAAEPPADFAFQLPLPPAGASWMLLLKLNCLEGNELAVHSKHYGLKVVGTDGNL